jgi:hypothetical protein
MFDPRQANEVDKNPANPVHGTPKPPNTKRFVIFSRINFVFPDRRHQTYKTARNFAIFVVSVDFQPIMFALFALITAVVLRVRSVAHDVSSNAK